jgi:hypothetical protein
VSAYLVVGVLDVINPDALIVQTNARYGHLESTDEGFGFDARPFASFSSDATPAIVDALPTLSSLGRRQAEDRLARRTPPLAESLRDWRSFNVSRVQAARALGIP